MSKFKNIILLLTGIAGVGKRSIAEAISASDPSFRFVHSHSWVDPILRLLGDESAVMNNLTQEGWVAINKIRDVIFDAMVNICPMDANFIITQELLEGNEWHKKFYEQVEYVAKKRNAKLIPIRLVCEIPVLLNRVVSEDRKKFFKTRDANLIKERASTTEVFSSNNKNELTLDTTNLLARESADKILKYLGSFC